jgi:hypothetical protein
MSEKHGSLQGRLTLIPGTPASNASRVALLGVAERSESAGGPGAGLPG